MVSYFIVINSDVAGGQSLAREMTDEEKMEYDRLTANMEQMRLRLDELTAGPVVYGYARVSTYGQAAHGNSLEEQKRQLRLAGAEEIYADIFTGKTTERPELKKLVGCLNKGDTLIVTKLDRLGRSVAQASALITKLIDAGITVNVLNVGVLSNDSVSHAMELLDDHSYKQVVEMTGISKATLAREKLRRTAEDAGGVA